MRDDDKIQKLLESLSPKPLPPELRNKILSTAYQSQKKIQVITPVLKVAFFICCILVVLAFVFDMEITNNENEHLAAIMEASQTSIATENSFQEIIEELVKRDDDLSLAQWLELRNKLQIKASKLVSYKSIVDRLREEINGN